MLTVYADMCADLCHFGHFAFIDQMYILANELAIGRTVRIYIGIHSDATIEAYKRRPIMTMDERCRMLSYHPKVDRVIVDAPLQVTVAYLQQHQVDILCTSPRTVPEMYKMYGQLPSNMIYTLLYTPGISTTDLINRIVSRVVVHTDVDRDIQNVTNGIKSIGNII